MNHERVSLSISPVKSPPRKSRLEAYLYDKSDWAPIELAQDLADKNRPLHSSGVLIPVAAHQEAGRIAHSMDEYAAQEGADPFTVILLLNYPKAIGSDSISESVEEVERAIARHPDLDIRYAVQDYEQPIIGQIRKDLWDATAYLALHDGIYDTPTGEFLAINHDIDTERIGRHYMRNVQNFYRNIQERHTNMGMGQMPAIAHATQVKHAYPFDTHPNIARATLWADFKFRQYSKNGCYEEGLVIPLSYYAQRGGFDATAKTYETHQLTKNLPRLNGVPGTPMDTSPRRYIERFGVSGYDKLWTNDSFSATDACREGIATPDITRDELESHIFTNFEHDLDTICSGVSRDKVQRLLFRRLNYRESTMLGGTALSRDELYANIQELIRPQLKLASAVLERVVCSPSLASLAIDEATVAQYSSILAKAIDDDIKKNWL